MAKTLVVTPDASVQVKNKRQQKEKLFYKIACLVYFISVIILLTFLIVRAFRYKYNNDYEKCHVYNWIDSVISILTMIIIVTASGTLVASFKYVFTKSAPKVEEITMINPTEDFIRRNSSEPRYSDANIVKNPSVGSNSWLTAVRNEAYETRRQSMQNPDLLHV